MGDVWTLDLFAGQVFSIYGYKEEPMHFDFFLFFAFEIIVCLHAIVIMHTMLWSVFV